MNKKLTLEHEIALAIKQHEGWLEDDDETSLVPIIKPYIDGMRELSQQRGEALWEAAITILKLREELKNNRGKDKPIKYPESDCEKHTEVETSEPVCLICLSNEVERLEKENEELKNERQKG